MYKRIIRRLNLGVLISSTGTNVMWSRIYQQPFDVFSAGLESPNEGKILSSFCIIKGKSISFPIVQNTTYNCFLVDYKSTSLYETDNDILSSFHFVLILQYRLATRPMICIHIMVRYIMNIS